MARGFIYEAVTEASNAGNMGEEDFYEDLGVLNVDYVADIESEERDMIVRDLFREIFEKFGAKTGVIHNCGNDGINTIYVVTGIGNDFRHRYFQKKYEQFKAYAQKMSLDQFAGNTQYPFDTYAVKLCMEDSYGDIVYLDNIRYTFDSFIRHAHEDRIYYFGTVVLAH